MINFLNRRWDEAVIVTAALVNIGFTAFAYEFCYERSSPCGFERAFGLIGSVLGLVPSMRTITRHADENEHAIAFLMLVLSVVLMSTFITGLIYLIQFPALKRDVLKKVGARSGESRPVIPSRTRISASFYDWSLAMWSVCSLTAVYLLFDGSAFLQQRNNELQVNFKTLALACIIEPFLIPGVLNIIALLSTKRVLRGRNMNF